MILRSTTSAGLAAIAAAALLLPGCARIRDRQGYVVDEVLIASVQPGVDTRESVTGTLGRPTFVGQFDERDWYYVSRDTRQLAFAMPKPTAATVLHIRFNEAGTVTAVNRTGLERVASIEPMDDKTPTLGRDRSLFEELFGNIGAVGAPGQSGRTTDNPQ
jgi:outer membrane protein assembly factor BamE (lipoprotein component of BamABCDE complex)